MYEIRAVPGKGLGFIATGFIQKGTCILSETPIVTVPLSMSAEDLYSKVLELSDEHRQSLTALCNVYAHDTLMAHYDGIVQTNAFDTGDDMAAVAIEASRINHACDNNSMHSWNKDLGQVTVYAVRDINPGEEITTNYFGRGMTRKERQTSLRDTYQFNCTCGLCSLPAELSAAMDCKIQRYRDVWENLMVDEGASRHSNNPFQRFRDLEDIVHHKEELGSHTQLYEAYIELSALAIAHSDIARAKAFFQKAYDSYIIEHGTEDSTARELDGIIKGITKSIYIGQSTRWTTTQEETPSQADQSIFENWLWNRNDETARPGRFANLQDRRTFLGIGGLPTRDVYDIEYHQYVALSQRKPVRHWCFVGEIVESATLGEDLKLGVKDVDEHLAFIVFNKDWTQKRYKAPKCQKNRTKYNSVENDAGQKEGEGDRMTNESFTQTFSKHDTIVILYAERMNPSSSAGDAIIHMKDTSMVKVLPFPLKKLLAASSRLQEYMEKCEGSNNTCHSCEKQGTGFDKCGRCKIYHYCSRDCQLKSWHEDSHKKDCKLLEHSDVRNLLNFEWHKFNGQVGFPLPAGQEVSENLAEKMDTMAL